MCRHDNTNEDHTSLEFWSLVIHKKLHGFALVTHIDKAYDMLHKSTYETLLVHRKKLG
jgi:hypothetical protein